MASKTNLEKSGAAQAALLSAMLGVLALALANLATEISEAAKTRIHNLGKLWMPGAEGIGPYSGKETILLLTWLVSWILLDRWLRVKELNHRLALVIFLIGIGSATTLLWPPVFSWFGHH